MSSHGSSDGHSASSYIPRLVFTLGPQKKSGSFPFSLAGAFGELTKESSAGTRIGGEKKKDLDINLIES